MLCGVLAGEGDPEKDDPLFVQLVLHCALAEFPARDWSGEDHIDGNPVHLAGGDRHQHLVHARRLGCVREGNNRKLLQEKEQNLRHKFKRSSKGGTEN